ncbi:alpha-hydroxy-acid oxidizing protein [Streptomyces sp. NPDC015242]|uniref:alpha-hydroxy-acid oxidizing protein n=1 Tax=Streptomyces sp. NPDC015242 TaxID=3364951 RepID=UPI0036FA5C1D
MEAGVWDFGEGGSGTEAVLAANRAAFADVALLPKMLTGVVEADTRTRLIRSAAAMPVAPMAYQRLAHAFPSCAPGPSSRATSTR